MNEPATEIPRNQATGLLGKLRLLGVLCLMGLLILGSYYFFFIQRKYSDLTGRDFRFLAAIGVQLNAALLNRAKILENQLDRKALEAGARTEKEQALLKALAPAFESLQIVEPQAKECHDPPALTLKTEGDEARIDARYSVLVGGDPGERQICQAAHPGKRTVLLDGSFGLQGVAEPIFRSRQAFDAILLADAGGSVVYRQGDRDLSVKNLSALVDRHVISRPGSGQEGQRSGTSLLASSETYSVEVNGHEYRLFVEPVDLPIQSLRSGSTTWLICGLVPKRDLLYKSMATSSALLSSLMGLLLLAALSWPFLKLILISDTQRVSVFDIALLSVCTVLGLSVATLLLLNTWFFLSLGEASRVQVETLSAQMQRNIGREIRASYEVMAGLEKEAIGRLNVTASRGRTLNDKDILNEYKSVFDKNHFSLIQTLMLLGMKGEQIYRGTINQDATPRFSVSERAYFKHVLSHDLWDLNALKPESKDAARPNVPARPFYVESLVGWSSGTRLAVLSKPTDGWHSPPPHVLHGEKIEPRVTALAVPMTSLVDPVLPPGFKFAVIDNDSDNGRVLFHSDSERNLTEDFLAETDQNRRLRSAVFARRAETMEVRYWGEDYLASVAPVQGLPWTIIVLKDLRLLRAVNISWTSTALLFVLLYSAILAILVAILLTSRPASHMTWVWPDAKRRNDYRHLIVAYHLLLASFALTIWGTSGTTPLIVNVTMLSLLALIMAYLRLQKSNPGWAVALTLGAVILTVLASSLWLTAIETAASPVLPAIIFLLVVIAFLSASGALQRLSVPKVSKAKTQRAVAAAEGLGLRSIGAPYCVAGGMLLFLLTVLPAAGYFKVSYNLHSVSLLRHGQLKMALEMRRRRSRAVQAAAKLGSARDFWLQQRLAVAGAPEPPRLAASLRGLDIYSHAFHGTRIELRPSRADAWDEEECRKQPQSESEIVPHFIEGWLPQSSEPGSEMRELLHSRASDCTWNWSEREGNDPSSVAYVLRSHDYPDGDLQLVSNVDQPIPIESSQESVQAPIRAASFATPSRGTAVGSLVFLILLGGLVAAVTRFIAKRIFLIDLLEPLWFETDDKGPATIGRNLFLVGKIRPWKRDLLRDVFSFIPVQDLKNAQTGWPACRQELLASSRAILIEGFDHEFRDPELNRLKLEMLEDLVSLQERTLVVTSTKSPALLFSNEIGGHGLPAGSNLPELERRWREVLSFFTIAEDDLLNSWRDLAACTQIQSKTLRAECGMNSYLLPIAAELDPHAPLYSREQILEELGERAERYYQGLWVSCSTDEQLVLEHLAEEGLVNEKSRRVIRRLMARGFIRREPKFRLMNETFRRFVLSSVNKARVFSLESDSLPSAWDRLRVPLFMGMATVLAVFLTTQQELLDGFSASVTGLTAGLPALLKLVGSFSGGRPGSSPLAGKK
jgi:hypothetical protein